MKTTKSNQMICYVILFKKKGFDISSFELCHLLEIEISLKHTYNNIYLKFDKKLGFITKFFFQCSFAR